MHARVASPRMLPAQQQALRAPQTIGIRSPAFQHGKQIPREYTGHGDDVSPPLEWTGVPERAQALAIIVDDPDAPRGTWTHWTAWNLPKDLNRLEEGQKVIPLGASEGITSAETSGYHGPMPPSGTHRYFFRIFALDKQLTLPPNAPIADVWRAVGQHAIAWGELMGTFTKP